MIKLHLYDEMAEKYGTTFDVSGKSAPEVIRCLTTQIPGFQDDIEAGSWHVVRGPLDAGDSVSEEKLDLELRPGEELHLIHTLSGAGNGAFSVILGVVLIVAGVFTGGTSTMLGLSLLAGGVGMVVGGIVQMTMKVPGADTTSGESSDSRASFLFNGPRNQSTQGVAIPRGYGRCLIGSIVISAGLFAEDVVVNAA